MYRRVSQNNDMLNAEGFIAAMFEVEDEFSSRGVRNERTMSEPIIGNSNPSSWLTVDDDDDDDELKRSSSLSHHRKERSQSDSELYSFLLAMEFSTEQIELAIQSLRNEGANHIDADAVVAILLSQPEEKSSKPLPSLDDSPSSKIDEPGQRELMKIEVTPGNFAPVLKGRQTLQAIRDGTAVSIRCTICSASLQCCPDAEYVLCPDCDVVNPILSQHRRASDRSSQSSHPNARSNRRMTTGGMIGAIGLGHKAR
jgi:hypothetical protein